MAWMIVPVKWVLGIALCQQARLFKKTNIESQLFFQNIFFHKIFFVVS